MYKTNVKQMFVEMKKKLSINNPMTSGAFYGHRYIYL